MSSETRITRRELLLGAAAAPLASRADVQHRPPFAFDPQADLIPAPSDPAEWPAFRERLRAWRREARARVKYDDVLYRKAEFRWAASCFVCGFVLLCDQAFYDPLRGHYTLDRFLDAGVRDFGGYDALVLWHAYPRIGVDDRNQFDFYREAPGGLAALRTLARRCRQRDVRVFIDYNPWDTGTRREPVGDLDALVGMVRAIEADGIFLDTMDRGAPEFRRRLDAVRPGVVLEGEIALPLERVHDHHMSWAQGFADNDVPGVLRNKWFERRHMQHQIARWSRDHTAELQAAWMNGSGILVWENVFGSWVGWSARDRSLLRAMAPVLRRYAGLFRGDAWTPLVPTRRPEVYASLWEGRGLRLWTLVNRSDRPVSGELLDVTMAQGRCYDLILGREAPGRPVGNRRVLKGAIPARGVGAFVQGPSAALGHDFDGFLAERRATYRSADYDPTFPIRVARSRPAGRRVAPAAVPSDMVAVPAGPVTLNVTFRARECGLYGGKTDLQADGTPYPLHQSVTVPRMVDLMPYAIDLTPVTNARFAEFLRATAYRPRHPERFLKHWRNGSPPVGAEEHPVVYVDLQDARAFARWAGKRLPTEEEWQFAAQGRDGRRYPWGNTLSPGRCNTGEHRGTTPVTAYPAGRSPFRCWDMCGNVWEWTESERTDGRTRFCIVRGGSWYRALGSDWYFDGGPQPADFAAKFLLQWSGLDRCATIGFRCAAGLQR